MCWVCLDEEESAAMDAASAVSDYDFLRERENIARDPTLDPMSVPVRV